MAILRGPIEVTTESEAPYLEQDGLTLNRNIVRKEFGGAVSGTSEAQMIAARTADPASAGYVAIEHFTGSVDGESGSMVVQHSGSVDKREPTLTIVIVPGSGTGDLSGISGTMEIDNDNGVHSYVLDYRLP